MPKNKNGQQNEQQEINKALKAALKTAKVELEKRQAALKKARKQAGEVASPELLWTMAAGVAGNQEEVDFITNLLHTEKQAEKEKRDAWKKSLKTAQKNLKKRSAEYKKASEKAELMAKLEEAVKQQEELVNLWQEQVEKATMDEWEVVDYEPQTEAGADYPTLEEIEAAVKEETPEFFDKPQAVVNMDYPTLEEIEAADDMDYPTLEEIEAADDMDYPTLEEIEAADNMDYPTLEEIEAGAVATPQAAGDMDYPTLEEIEAGAKANAPADLAAAEPHSALYAEDVVPAPEERLEAAQPAMQEIVADANASENLAAAEPHSALYAENVIPAPEERLAPAPHVEKSPEQLAAEEAQKQKEAEEAQKQKAAEEARKQKEAEEKEREKTLDINRAMDDIVREQVENMGHIVRVAGQFNGKAVDSLEDNVKAFAKDKKHNSREFTMMRDALNDLNIENCVSEIALKNVTKRGDLSTVQKYQEKLQRAREATQAYIDKKQGEFVSGTLGLGTGGNGLNRAQATMEQLDKMMVCLDSIVENRKSIEEVADYKYDIGEHGQNINLKQLEKKVADRRQRPAKKQVVKKAEVKKDAKKDVKKGKKI